MSSVEETNRLAAAALLRQKAEIVGVLLTLTDVGPVVQGFRIGIRRNNVLADKALSSRDRAFLSLELNSLGLTTITRALTLLEIKAAIDIVNGAVCSQTVE
jgi:hypothetical protein